MFCNKCGNQNADGIPFCAHCGAPLSVPGYAPMAPAVVPGKGMGIAGMVLGIVALVLFCFWYISMPCAIIAVILGGVAASKAKAAGMKNGAATAGIVCGCIAIGLVILGYIFLFAMLAEMGVL